MKVVWKLFTVWIFLLSASVSGFVLNFPISETSDVKFIASGKLLFDALLKSSALEKYVAEMPGDENDMQQIICLSNYTRRNYELLFASGAEIRDCAQVSDWEIHEYFVKHNAKHVEEKFVKNLSDCTKKHESKNTMDCYVDVISHIFKKIRIYDIGYYSKNKHCIRIELEKLVDDMKISAEEVVSCTSEAGETSWIPFPRLNNTNSWNPFPPWNVTNPQWNNTNPWIPLPPWNDTYPWNPIPPWNDTNLWNPLPPWNNSMDSTNPFPADPFETSWWKNVWKKFKHIFERD